MVAPSAIHTPCPNCGETLHRVLKGKVTGRRETVFEGVVKCQSCGRVGDITLREPKAIKVKFIVSWMDASERTEVEIEPDLVIQVGDIMETEAGRVKVTAIESEGRRVAEVLVKDAETVWAKKADEIRLKVSVSRGRRIRSGNVFVQPDSEVRVGDVLDMGKGKVVVERIKVSGRMLYKGGAAAVDIVRIYARPS